MSKTPLLLLHGALGSTLQFKRLIPLISEHFDPLVINFEGHGGQAVDRDFSMGNFTQNALELLDPQTQPIPIFGYSMGGYVALKAALIKPEKISQIITLGTKFDWSQESTAKEIRMLNPEKVEEKVPRFAQMLEQEHAPEDWKKVMRQTAGMMQKLADGERLTEKDLKQINTPVVIGLGSLDQMVGQEESLWASEQLPNADLEILEGVEHPIQKVDNEVLRDFLLRNFKWE